MKTLYNDCFWPGRGSDITKDFPEVAERKFWSRIFHDTARAVFDRRVGNHEHSFWQAQAIHQAHAAGLLVGQAVRVTEPDWTADTLDRREFEKFVNGIDAQEMS
jgi:hypothetical protein